jgi:enoyl-CoA hydratase/carnithine racemase
MRSNGHEATELSIKLNRPERLNTIVPPVPAEFEQAIRAATGDESVKVIIVRGAGHFVHQERPDEINRLLLDWMKDEPAGI